MRYELTDFEWAAIRCARRCAIAHRGMTAEREFSFGFNPIPPVQPPLQKYFCSRLGQITCISLAVPSHTEGRFAIVTDVRRDAVDVGCATDERAACGRRSRVVLTPRRWCQVLEKQASCKFLGGDGGKKARSPAIECTHLCCRSRRGLIPWWASVLQRVMLCRWKLDWDDLAIVAWKKGGVIA